MRPSPSLYNQGSLSDDDFVANFVARNDVLNALVRRLQATGSDDGTSHHILVGARGMGKTSLLRRLAIAINRDEDLAKRYVPLTFREEQYNVLTLCTFWKNCGESLAEWAEAVGDDALANKIDLALPTSAWASDEGAASQFAGAMAELGKRAVLLIDNLDIVLAPLPPEKHWEFRRHLQAAHGPVVIGAATQLLAVSTDPQSAFYEFFQPHFLEALSMQETEICMRSLAVGRGQNGAHVLKVLTGQPERLKTLHTLTGGNPRVLALVYRLLEARESEEAMADLEILLDQVTPYYKSRIEEYQTPQQRAVIDAIALHWDPITTSSLAETTSIPSTTLSPLLIKLRKDGFIESTETSGSYAGHQLVERFLNIWYLMRHGTRRARQKMRWLVAFLSSFYSPSDLKEIASRAKLERGPDCWQQEYAYAFEEALARNSLLGFAGPSVPATASFPDGLNEPQRLVGRSEAGRDEASTLGTQKLVSEALDAWTAGRFPSLHDALDDLSPNFGGRIGSVELAEFARALVNKGITLGQTGDHAAAIAVYDEVLARFGDAEEPALRERVAMALVNKGNRLGQTGDSVAAIAAYDEVLARFGDAKEPALRQRVARALVNKGYRHGQTGDSVAEIAAYDEVLARFGDAEEPVLREAVAMALVNKGIMLGQTGVHAAAIAVYDEALARFGDAKEPALREQVAMALVNKGNRLGQTGDSAAAIAVYDEVLARFGDAEEPALRGQFARALVNKGITLGQTGDSAEAIAAYDEVLARFGDAKEPALREAVARALFNKGNRLGQTGDSVAEIAAYDEVLARFGDAEEPALREQVAMALVDKGYSLGQTGDHAAAIAAYDEVLARFGDAKEPALREQVTIVQVLLANLYIDTISNTLRAEDLLLQATIRKSQLAKANLAWLYLLTGRVSDALPLLGALKEIPEQGLALLEAALEFDQDNFGSATTKLAAALGGELETGGWDFHDDLNRLLRLAEQTGYGERLVTWFEEAGYADRISPVYVAFKAYVRGERILLDSSPEVQQPAKVIFDRLMAPRRHQQEASQGEKDKPKRGRGRPRKT